MSRAHIGVFVFPETLYSYSNGLSVDNECKRKKKKKKKKKEEEEEGKKL